LRGDHHAEPTCGRDIDRAARHRGAVDAGNVGRGLGSADAYGIALGRHTPVADVDVVTASRQIIARQIPLRNVVGTSRVGIKRAVSVAGVLVSWRVAK